jgi:hypothetical protein
MEMLYHFKNLLLAIFANISHGLSISLKSAIVFSIALPLLSWFIYIGHRRWHKTTPLRQAISESFTSINMFTRISMIVLSIFWIAIFTYYSVITVYQDHMNLVRANQELRKQMPPVPTPNLSSIRLAGTKHFVSNNKQFPYGLEVVMQTDETIESVSYAIIFSGEIDGGEAFIEPYSQYANKTFGVLDGKRKAFAFQWSSPAFTPDKPIKIRVYSKKYVDVVTWNTWTRTKD